MQYDHRTKAGNEGDIVKHPALVTALCGLLAEHDEVFRYADAFAGRWDNDLNGSVGWKGGIQRYPGVRDRGGLRVRSAWWARRRGGVHASGNRG